MRDAHGVDQKHRFFHQQGYGVLSAMHVFSYGPDLLLWINEDEIEMKAKIQMDIKVIVQAK